MMFPLRNDVTIECDAPDPWKSNSTFCKIVRAVVFVVGVLFLLLLISAWSQSSSDESSQPSPSFQSSPTEAPPQQTTCTVEIDDKMKQEIKSWIQTEIQKNSKQCSASSSINPEQVRNLVKEEIKRQQKIQLKPDFASASAGGLVIKASPTWTDGYSYIYFLFIPIRSTAPPPSIALEPTRQAGDCWPMEGRKGNILIQLAARANIVGFTMEHIDPAMSLSGATSEAPNNFSVYGVEDPEMENKKHLFGIYTYDNKNDEESQYFRVQNINRKSYLYILLEISSNHGNDKYTCLYRFQVHGFIDRINHCM
ncbi:hypothetical protein RUM43_007035 [Polyplax serrata]|uniref:SUN domain-containing protein n=1 Tax=Polyplax serrata TaxID=468196 RepID=A0AAN8PWH6_POLSC